MRGIRSPNERLGVAPCQLRRAPCRLRWGGLNGLGCSTEYTCAHGLGPARHEPLAWENVAERVDLEMLRVFSVGHTSVVGGRPYETIPWLNRVPVPGASF